MKKTVSLSLALIIALVAASCGEAAQTSAPPSGNDPGSEVQTEARQAEQTEAEETRIPLGVPDADYGGAEFVIMALERGIDGNDAQFTEFTYDPDRSGEGINDAVYQRNLFVEE